MSTNYNMTDVLWLLLCGVLVLFMQAGFTCLEDGFVRRKNSVSVAIKNVVDLLISSAVFWAFGFALMFGNSLSGIVGTEGLFFSGGEDPWFGAFFLFQLVFAGTAATIISGAVAERIKFAGYIVITVIVASVVYPLFGHWAWAGVALGGEKGWLASLGFIDFAGATVVHSVGGWAALAAIIVIGPRTGRFVEGGKAPQAHNLPMSAVGVLLLWVGWMGFNGGSTLALTSAVPGIILNTFLAGSFGGLAGLVAVWWIRGYPDVHIILNGILAGLVAITASANVVTPLSAVAIGSVSALLGYGAASLLERRKIDDVVGAVPVHAVGGVWGTLAVALFSDPVAMGTGLERWEQLAVQGLGVFMAFVWSFGLCYVLLRIVNCWFPLRVSLDTEQTGLNLGEHGLASDSIDLLKEMEDRESADYGLLRPLNSDPMSEMGEIAAHYNLLLSKVNEARKQAIGTNIRLQQSLVRTERDVAEKKVLLQEIHHRVKNNLQVVSSLLSLQAGAEKNTDIIDALNESERRIRVMARVHENLYRAADLAHVSAMEYLNAIANDAKMSHADSASGIAILEDVDDITMDIERAIPIGQIVSELISNSFKHAFPNTGEGTVTISLKRRGDNEIELVVSDDGTGLPDGYEFENSATLGLKLVTSLAANLDGKITVDTSRGDTSSGTRVGIRFAGKGVGDEKTHIDS